MIIDYKHKRVITHTCIAITLRFTLNGNTSLGLTYWSNKAIRKKLVFSRNT